jgi:hypothetical protein
MQITGQEYSKYIFSDELINFEENSIKPFLCIPKVSDDEMQYT